MGLFVAGGCILRNMRHIKEFLKKAWDKYGWVLFAVIVGLVTGVLWLQVSGFGLSSWTFWGQTLWDWFDLMLIPVVLLIGGYFLQRSERETDRKSAAARYENDRKNAADRYENDREIAADRYENDREIAREARLDKTLDEYLKAMTALLLQEGSLLTFKGNDLIRNVARTETLTVIKRLDAERNFSVFQFLHGTELVGDKDEMRRMFYRTGGSPSSRDIPGDAIVSLAFADLQKVELELVNLFGVNLAYTILVEANLKGANLAKANLQRAYLNSADLTGANLVGVNLVGVNLAGANLQNATMPDGTKYSPDTDLTKFTNPPDDETEND